MNLKHYENTDNERKEDVINFIYKYNESFGEFDYTIEKQCNEWLLDKSKEKLEGIDAIRHYYESLCDELIVVTNNDDEIIACRFVEYDEDDTYMKIE